MLFFARITTPFAGKMLDVTAEQQEQVLESHAYWNAKLASGELVLGGAVQDPQGMYAVYIFRADNEAAVREALDADPAYDTLRYSYELFAMSPESKVSPKASG